MRTDGKEEKTRNRHSKEKREKGETDRQENAGKKKKQRETER